MSRGALSRLLPEQRRARLLSALDVDSQQGRIDAIDRVTDELVTLGLCRPRGSMSQWERWAKVRREGWGGSHA
jgi:hypothetical protein